ncbi:hypothetical protein [Thiohalomonas denitrificans]|uniref:hypothetical protein n=1 Tax=Thiohalomonas denitrificans TaxID=415747 RepID=UPI0026EB50A0|nr:hypothetical protein [Thiohalomonas denitrificans]
MSFHKVLRKLVLLLAFLPVASFAADGEAVVLSFSSTDVQAVAERDGSFCLQLNPTAAARLQQVTENSYGKRLEVYIEGIPVLSAYVNTAIDSGVIEVPNPPPGVRRRLEPLQPMQ